MSPEVGFCRGLLSSWLEEEIQITDRARICAQGQYGVIGLTCLVAISVVENYFLPEHLYLPYPSTQIQITDRARICAQGQYGVIGLTCLVAISVVENYFLPEHLYLPYPSTRSCRISLPSIPVSFFVYMSKTLELSATYNLEYVIGFAIAFFYSSIDGSKTLQVYEV